MSIMLSICIVTYNHERYIEECIESIFEQNMDFEYEILIGDDCSKDGTVEILKKYENKVSVIERQKNIGLCANMYDLFMRVRGRYIFLIAGDDYLCHKNILRTHVNFLESNHKYCMVTGWNYLLDMHTGEMRNCRFEKEVMEYTLKDYLAGGGVFIGEGTIRNTFSEDKETNRYLVQGARNNEEMKIWLYLLEKGKVCVLPEQFYVYRYVTEVGESNYNATHTMLEIFEDYYKDLILLRGLFGDKYNFTPLIMHKANEFCVKCSDSIINIIKFLRILKAQDIFKLFLYKAYLKFHQYKDPIKWNQEQYLFKNGVNSSDLKKWC